MIFLDLKGISKFGKILSSRVPLFNHVYSFGSKNLYREGPAFVVKEKINRGEMKPDYRQMSVVEKLQEVYEKLEGYSPKKNLFSGSPKGLYIHGSVGAGKTMLMDIFYNAVKMKSKRRSHFNDFMTDVHSRVHALKRKKFKSFLDWNNKTQVTDLMTPVARELVDEAWLLCFDEFQVTDIADAMILKRLFTKMFENGMVMVATSNRAPDDLYKNGLQRSNFLPFIPILKKHCNIVSLSGKDYRAAESDGIEEHYLITDERSGSNYKMSAAFDQLCSDEKKMPEPKDLNILGHKITFANTCGRVLYASFKELCDRPLGTIDYIQIAKHFDTILIKNVPQMNLETRNQARRFIILIDTLYNYKKRVKISAAVPPHALFSNVNAKQVNDDQERKLMDDLDIERESEEARASLFSGSEEVFAFKRAVSRINEMCSKTYWNRYKKRKN